MNSNNEMKKFLSKSTIEMLNFIYDAIYIVDTERNIVFWSLGAEKATGYSANETIGRCCKDGILNHIDSDGTLVCVCDCPLVTALKEGRPIEKKVYPLNKNGERFAVCTHVSPIRNEEGKIIGAIEIFRDITLQEKYDALQKKFEKITKQYLSENTYQTIKKTAEGGADLKAELKDLTVLFMDIVSFTTISEKYGSESVVEMLNHFFSISTQLITSNCGDVDKFIGDCVMAVFIDANDALKTAEEFLGDSLSTLNRLLKSKNLPEINVRIGINSGRLVQGNIGSDKRKDMTVIGDVVNTAARVQAEANPGCFLISEATLARTDRKNAFEFHKEILLKGKNFPVKLFRPK